MSVSPGGRGHTRLMLTHTGWPCGARSTREGSSGGFGQSGLTVIELLVVVLVIGILAGIGIPAFLNQKSKGSDAEAKSVAVAATQAMESCATANGGDYRNCSKDTLLAAESSLRDAGDRLLVQAGLGNYEIVVKSKRDSEAAFTVSRASDGTVSRTCVTGSSDSGGCITPTVGTW
jgi:prepilin-type N-terminal cleavage/methylation domain-containing protein